MTIDETPAPKTLEDWDDALYDGRLPAFIRAIRRDRLLAKFFRAV